MHKNVVIRLIFGSFGIALLLAGLFFENGFADSIKYQTTPVFTSTPDRLAEPTLPPSPSQADYGSQVYWLNCSPCHGDRAQGLTDEFRQQYPPEDQNCWTSHCHGKVTYEDGFTIPTVVPALVGHGSLNKFATAANLFGFIRASMPFQNPGVLSDEEYYQIVSFILRQNNLIDDGVEINESNAAVIVVSQATVTVPPPQVEVQKGNGGTLGLIILGIFFILFLLFLFLKKRQNKTTI